MPSPAVPEPMQCYGRKPSISLHSSVEFLKASLVDVTGTNKNLEECCFRNAMNEVCWELSNWTRVDQQPESFEVSKEFEKAYNRQREQEDNLQSHEFGDAMRCIGFRSIRDAGSVNTVPAVTIRFTPCTH